MSATAPIFGKYEVIRRIASGGMGDIYLARQVGTPGFERLVILKTLLADLAADEGFVEQFLDEARVAARLNHPAIVSLFEVGRWEGTYLIAMEYIRGADLVRLLVKAAGQQERIPEAVAAQVIMNASLGLDHAHYATDDAGKHLGIIHRDISPQNIMVRHDGVTKVVDFGIAKAKGRATRTATGNIKGKLTYMSPEQALSHELDARSDQFSLGIVLWEMVTGRRLFASDNPVKTISMITVEPIPPPSSVVSDVAPLLEQLIMRMLARDPTQRFDRCADVARALKGFLDGKSEEVGEVLVARCYKRLLGDHEAGPIDSIAPDQENFLVSLTPVSGGRRSPVRRWLAAAGVTAGVAAAALAVLVAVRPAKAPAPAVPQPAAAAVDAPAVAASVLSLRSEPSGAAVFLGSTALGETPLELDRLSPGTAHTLVLEKRGFEPARIAVQLVAGESETRTVRLTKTTPRSGPREPQANARPSAAAAESAPGFATIVTKPWTKVAIDGQWLGETPLAEVKLAAGSHSVRMVNDAKGIDATRTLVVRPGQVTKLTLELP